MMSKKRTQAQTPAPKKDQIKGSAKNKPGSASGKRGAIEVSEKTEAALKNLRDAHNKKYKAKSKQVDLGTLKAVYRRGSGAFSSSHRPNVTSRDQWSLARVKAFLKLVGTGERKKAYNTDLDLLPAGHPQKVDKNAEMLAVPEKYKHIDFTPPKAARQSAKRALEVRATKPSSQRGLTAVGIARARDLANGRELSPDTVKRMYSYFSRHEVDKKSKDWPNWSKGRIAWEAWGGDAGFSFSRKVVNQMKKADEKINAFRAFGAASALMFNENAEPELKDGLRIGRKIRALSIGQVANRLTGKPVSKEITLDVLNEIVRVFKETRNQSPVIIDWNHNSSPYGDNEPTPPEVSGAYGEIIDIEIKDNALYVTPAYNKRGVQLVENSGGVLFPSPEFIQGEVFSRSTGKKVGDAQLLAVTLTSRPAQSQDIIDRIQLSERYQMNDLDKNETMEETEEKSVEQRLQEVIEENKGLKNLVEELNEKLKEKDKEIEEMKEHDSKEEMNEHYDDKDKVKLSEASSQVTSLTAQVTALQEKHDKLAQELHVERRDKAIGELLTSGKITPAERPAAEESYDNRLTMPLMWEMLNERIANSAVNLSTVGHGADLREVKEKSVIDKIRSLSEEKGISFNDAVSMFKQNNTDEYNNYFKG
jgi:phage I-like protein